MSDFGNLDGRTAIVTGASTGIGRAIALEFSRAGATVGVHYRASAESADEVVRAIVDNGGVAKRFQADLAINESLRPFVDEVWAALGPIDVWVNNAGVDLLTGPAADWCYERKLDALYQVDVRGTAMLSRLVGARMLECGGGTLLNIGWDQAERGMEGDSGELFAAAKNAVMGMSRSLALSLAPDVRVNCIAPGWIKTAWGESASSLWHDRVVEETPLRRWGKPEDVAKVARFLASAEADYITGQVIYVNGGAER